MPTIEKVKDTIKSRQPKHHPKYNVILFNDDVNDALHVLQSLCTVIGIEEEQAYVIMMTAHTTGKALVITCELEHAEHYKQGLNDKGLQATIEEA